MQRFGKDLIKKKKNLGPHTWQGSSGVDPCVSDVIQSHIEKCASCVKVCGKSVCL